MKDLFNKDNLWIDLGCGRNKEPGFIGLDNKQFGQTDCIVDLDVFPWPIKDSAVQKIVARHIFEFLSDPIKVLQECERVLAPSGIAQIILFTTDGRGAFSCPMHKSFWNLDLIFNFLPDSLHIVSGNHEMENQVVTFEFKIIKKDLDNI